MRVVILWKAFLGLGPPLCCLRAPSVASAGALTRSIELLVYPSLPPTRFESQRQRMGLPFCFQAWHSRCSVLSIVSGKGFPHLQNETNGSRAVSLLGEWVKK